MNNPNSYFYFFLAVFLTAQILFLIDIFGG